MLYFDNLIVKSKLGEGGMSEVYLVQDEKRNLIALKNLKKGFLNNHTSKARFKNESAAVKKLSHPNIIKIYKSAHRTNVSNGSTKYQTLSYLMEYFSARSLKELIQNNRLKPEEITKLLIKILDALDYCHKRRVYHRDLKPANILLRRNHNGYEPVITDFGIAKFKNSELTNIQNLTVDVAILGAPAYMSPEQIRNPKNIDQRSDLYSLGIILYEMTTNQKPFIGARDEILVQQLSKTAVSPSRINSQVNPKLEKLILSLLEKDPKNRPQNASEVRSYLDGKDYTGVQNNQVTISLYHRGNFVKQKTFLNLPISIGKSSLNTKKQNKFEISDQSDRIESTHCTLFANTYNTINVKDSSRLGTIVNKIKIKGISKELNKNFNEILLPNSNLLRIQIVPRKKDFGGIERKPLIIISIVLGIFIITMIILLILL